MCLASERACGAPFACPWRSTIIFKSKVNPFTCQRFTFLIAHNCRSFSLCESRGGERWQNMPVSAIRNSWWWQGTVWLALHSRITAENYWLPRSVKKKKGSTFIGWSCTSNLISKKPINNNQSETEGVAAGVAITAYRGLALTYTVGFRSWNQGGIEWINKECTCVVC